MTEGSVNTAAVKSTEEEDEKIKSQVDDFKSFLEDIFLISKTQDTENHFCLDAFNDILQENISKNDLLLLVYKRLCSKKKLVNVLKENPKLASSQAYETDPMKYLAECHARLHRKYDEKHRKLDDCATTCSTIIKKQAKFLVRAPIELGIPFFSPTKHLKSLLRSNDESVTEHLSFYAELVDHMKDEGIFWLYGLFEPLLRSFLKDVKGYKRSLESSFSAEGFRFPAFLDFFARNETLAITFLKYDRYLIRQRASYEKSLLGNLLTLGPSPDIFSVSSDCLDNHGPIVQSPIDDLEVHKFMDVIQHGLYNFFHKVLKFKNEVKKELLSWIGDALHFYKDRKELWNINHAEPTISSDNFLINLQNTLLKVFEPFLDDPSKLVDIQHTYCWATNNHWGDVHEAPRRNVHMREIEEIYLNRSLYGKGSAPSLEDNYNFISEMFYMTHYCCYLGFSVIRAKLSQKIDQMRALRLCCYYKMVLEQPHTLEKTFEFISFTATYLVHAAMTSPDDPAPLNINNAKLLPPSGASGALLGFIPEFLLYNMFSCLNFLKDFHHDFFKEQDEKDLGNLFEFFLLFMSNHNLIHNPGGRALLVYFLGYLIPSDGFHSENRFLVKNPNACHLMECLIKFLVGIGPTSPEMDDKTFCLCNGSFRDLFIYLCHFSLHRQALQGLAKAEDHSLFLKFTNVLAQNAIFWLDRGLKMMKEVRNKDKDEQLSEAEREELENKMMLAQYANKLSSDTISILEEVCRNLCFDCSHLIEAALIAVTINYYLQRFAGTTKVNMTDLAEFEFRPDDMLKKILYICEYMLDSEVFIRILSRCEDVCRLLAEAGKTVSVGPDVGDVVEQISEVSRKEREEEEAGLQGITPDMTDDFTGGLARDPVTVPTNRTVGVRVAIEKWLRKELEDSTTIEKIVPDQDLSSRIEDLLAQRCNQ